MLYLFLEDTEWPWVVLVCMQMVVLMPVEIAPCQKIYVKIAPPYLTFNLQDNECIIICGGINFHCHFFLYIPIIAGTQDR